MDIFESSYEMVNELIDELDNSIYIDGGIRLDFFHKSFFTQFHIVDSRN